MYNAHKRQNPEGRPSHIHEIKAKKLQIHPPLVLQVTGHKTFMICSGVR